jgi:hypothetical protein
MPHRDYERHVIERRKEKSHEIHRADDPEPVFELKLGRAHARTLAAGM